jgi:hypothetical protein
MEYLGMNFYYNRSQAILVHHNAFVGETRMVTADATILLYLSECVPPVGRMSQQRSQGTGGRGARANGHESDHHDGLRSLYNFRTLFHGASAHPKEDQRQVTGVNAHSKKLNTCR